ncbi:PaaI family thioesterase [Aeromicrobium sp. SMF47]|uniref:PaaI family thioesterase n=1 Tax=Aeromicrobium yanjiei TaxID=2662028 RepID=UPI00129DE9B7|nr:PaaI family thioesterase [Aeromicrobium yanjiei]MRJ75890.1 PaaI family thioesterase [Aeromicrobium yanjiei]
MGSDSAENHFDSSAGPEQVRAFGTALEALRGFHDALTAAAPSADVLERLAADLQRWTQTLTPLEVPEPDRLAGRLRNLPVRGHPALPPVLLDVVEDDKVEGTVTFGTFFLGRGGAAHGGTIATVFDEVLGVMASHRGHSATRTAYLKTDFRSIVPIGEPIRIRGWMDREEGRKRYVRGELWAGDTLCAEAEALFVVERQG